MIWYVYIVSARDASLYTGITTDPKRRIKTHNAKTGAKALRGKIPVRLVFLEKYTTKNSALKREAEIKNLKREYKLKLIKSRVDLTGKT